MINKVLHLFHRYAHRHAAMQKQGFPLLDSSGNVFGHIDRITIRENRLGVEGWALAGMVGLVSRDQAIECAPSLTRDDVLNKFGDARGKTPGFALDIPLNIDYSAFWAEIDGVRYVQTIPRITINDLRAMRRGQIIPFIKNGVRAFPSGISWLIYRDPLSAARIKTALGLNTVPRTGQLNTLLFASDVETKNCPPPELELTGITIIMPVYNALNLLPEVLTRVVDHTDLPWRLIVIEDCSSDPEVLPWLRKWKDNLPESISAYITIIENQKNLGFIRSVNSALAVALPLGAHVVLLNSDAFVPVCWASRLIRPLLEHDNVATVTPMSNDAEIFNIPTICQRQQIKPGEGDAIDRVAASFFPGADLTDAPTGVGFCMAMHIDYLRKLPELDVGFGRGYGEEVDWCQRARKLGGRHLGNAGLFVEHRGGTSFGSSEKSKLIHDNNQIISKRYPKYDTEVQDFIAQDPLKTPRLALALAWAGIRQKSAVPIYLAHDMGGGAEHYLQDQLKVDLISGSAAVVLRVGGQSRWQIELHTIQGVTRGETDSISFIRRLFDLLPTRRIVYSCAVGDRDPISLPDVIVSLAHRPGDLIEILMHDFFPLSPSYTLLGSDGAYHGLPMPETNNDPVHSVFRADGTRANLSDWRAAWGALFDAAHKITVFSNSSRDLVIQAYPKVAHKLSISPHMLSKKMPKILFDNSQRGDPVIGVLGNIGYQKGAAVLREFSQLLKINDSAKLVILGSVDPAYKMSVPTVIHGGYRIEDIPGLVKKYGINRWLIPSIWPETFSYTTHEAIATGLPVFSFNLGAQGEATSAAAKKSGHGGIINMNGKEVDLEVMLRAITEKSEKRNVA
ncbi:glycosyltransferase [Paracoccus sp. PAMC 22219]|uniref:glycosyltransferase n=1 Tax=Paracoccus sp. PAMC 22219 TaxID=1569209 RepID=UPI000AB1B1E7|nr:glycosyltransferase [Paracoccus sp. PAMC 22219]